MHELGVFAYCDDLGTGLPELLLQLCQSRKFGGSDKGKIRRIEKQHRPFLFLLQ